jgi:hypothetical protein
MAMAIARIRANLQQVAVRIERAALRSGRAAGDVRLVAVTKYVPSETARALVAAGCARLGESRPQELWSKAEALGDLPVEWHLIGHLQRNKARRTVPLVRWIHSVDQTSLLEEIEKQPLVGPVDVLIEVNVSGDPSKHGIAPEMAEPFLASLPSYRNSRVRGLMTMAAREGDLDTARRNFAALRVLRDRLRTRVPDHVSLDELSMGMTADFEIAIEEGATMVRIGSALFEGAVR